MTVRPRISVPLGGTQLRGWVPPSRKKGGIALIRRGLSNFMSKVSFKRFGFCAAGILVGLGLASIAYQVVSLIAVAVSSAETVGDLHVGWFLIRMLVAVSVAKVSGGWLCGLRLRK